MSWVSSMVKSLMCLSMNPHSWGGGECVCMCVWPFVCVCKQISPTSWMLKIQNSSCHQMHHYQKTDILSTSFDTRLPIDGCTQDVRGEGNQRCLRRKAANAWKDGGSLEVLVWEATSNLIWLEQEHSQWEGIPKENFAVLCALSSQMKMGWNRD